jgi:hypothetical protein
MDWPSDHLIINQKSIALISKGFIRSMLAEKRPEILINPFFFAHQDSIYHFTTFLFLLKDYDPLLKY